VTLGARLREHVLADDAEAMLAHYLDGSFSGAWFEKLGGPGDDPSVADRFTPADILAVSTLSVKIGGWPAIELLYRRADELTGLLEAIPRDVDLQNATDEHLASVYAAQNALNQIDGIGHVSRSKLLARKRPRIVPIRDTHVLLALMGRDHGNFAQPLREALRGDDEVRGRLEALGSTAERSHLSLLRVLDIVVWMRAHGAASVKPVAATP
jgi:hypothetical protein